MPDIIQEAIAELSPEESYRRFAYLDSRGILTIGYGRNCKDKGISKEEALYLLTNDIEEAIKDLTDNLFFFTNLPNKIQIVLIDMCFQMGLGGLLEFKTFLNLLEKGLYKEASEAMLNSTWAKETSNRAELEAKIVSSFPNR